MSEATFKSFEAELGRLVDTFGKNLTAYKGPGYDEASLRQEFLNPFFRALGWDMENKAGLIPQHREVEIESRSDAGRADYLFRTARLPRFICEAKKPAEELPPHAQQAKGYAWTIGVPLAVLSDFEELNLYIVGGEPKEDEPLVGLWKTYHFRDYVAKAQELWDLLARDNVASGSIDRLVASLPKRPLKLGKGQFVIRPDPTQNFDTKFLDFLDRQRRSLASDLIRHNDRADLLEGTRLNEAVQSILDRLLFVRISEARGIDMGTKLESLLASWKKRQQREAGFKEEPPANWGGAGLGTPKGSLWHSVVRHLRGLDRRPPSHVPFFNGNLFKHHPSEELVVGDGWLEEFLEKICNEYSAYKFGYIAVEILGTIYERFLGKIVRPHGRGTVIEEKPEVRKAGGVYYTPRYIVEYIVEQTVGKMLEGKKPEDTLQLRFLDPACGSGSFLLRVFERVCEYWQQWLMDDLRRAVGDEVTSLKPEGKEQGLLTSSPTIESCRSRGNETLAGTPSSPRLLTSSPTTAAWLKKHRAWCWVEEKANTLHLTVWLKRRILRETVFGVDLDPQAVEVTQLSLYLKMLEGETTETLEREQEWFHDDEPILPPLQDNIKCGNSLIASDFSMMADDLVRVKAFDWPVQFPAIMKAGGFDAVVGNPPYVYGRDWAGLGIGNDQKKYFSANYSASPYQLDLFSLFMERAIYLTVPGGTIAQIVPNVWLTNRFSKTTRGYIFSRLGYLAITAAPSDVFEGIVVDTVIYSGRKGTKAPTFDLARITERFVEKIGTFACADYADGATPITTTSSKNVIELARELVRTHTPLGSVTQMTRGVHPYRADGFGESAFKKGCQTQRDVDERPYHSTIRKPGWSSFIYGKDLHRWAPPIHLEYVKYGPWLAEPRDPRFFSGPRVYSRKILGDRLVVTYEEAESVADQQVYITKPTDSGYSAKYLTGVLGSRLVAFFIRAYFDECTKAFPQIKVSQLREIPIAKPDKARHDKLVGLVDKMLALTPKLRAAQSDAERQTLQNAVTATDQQIDALVYALYGLTEDEIELVEGTP
jgi:hypothetical protein